MFETVKTSANGNVRMAKLPLGYAVAVRVKEWNATARTFMFNWQTKARHLTEAQAESMFAGLAA